MGLNLKLKNLLNGSIKKKMLLLLLLDEYKYSDTIALHFMINFIIMIIVTIMAIVKIIVM